MSKDKHNFVITAHPDDETIWFGALMLTRRRRPWTVICVTDGNADGMGTKRRRQFAKACKLLKVQETHWLGFPDVYKKRLDIDALTEVLAALPRPAEVFTHGIIGEYGHPHHQDVSYAVHRTFTDKCPVYSPAYNCFPDFTCSVTRQQFALKGKILTEVYGSETQRFANLLPVTACEGFSRVSLDEVRALYRYFRDAKRPNQQSLKYYKWFWPHLRVPYDPKSPRPF